MLAISVQSEYEYFMTYLVFLKRRPSRTSWSFSPSDMSLCAYSSNCSSKLLSSRRSLATASRRRWISWALLPFQSFLASSARMSYKFISANSPLGPLNHQLTSDLVQIMPTFDSWACRASSNTLMTPTSVVARPI